MTDIGTTPRGSMSPTRRLRIFEAHGGVCCLCERKIRAGEKWTIEHLRALALGGTDTDDNCGPAHDTCRRIKDKADLGSIAKAKRMKMRHLGIKSRSTFQTSREGKWKGKIGGGVVLR